MRPVFVVLLAAAPVPAPAFADTDLGPGGDPGLAPAAKTVPGPKKTPPPNSAQLSDPSVDEAKFRALVEDATRWFVGPPVSLADTIHAATQAVAAGNGSGAPSFGGGWSAGVVIAPVQHPDARPHPLGMVTTPPDVNDSFVIPPGCDGLKPRPPHRASSGWRKLFADLAQAAEATSPCPKML
ncbi:MAG TPA: hypothetical protein VN253_27360 [Kofleriaceae bacterium]|nr:hypothetical protein [Kofleriaceae bacterium]